MTHIKTFRGLIADGGIDTISLHTNDGSTGYRITKLELYPQKFGNYDQKSTLTIFKVPQAAGTATNLVDFSDQTLLAASCLSTDNSEANPLNTTTVFDHEVVNQDITVCHKDAHADNRAINYYIELEQVRLDLSENTVATLKDIRNITAPT